jgi:hypothetical protein
MIIPHVLVLLDVVDVWPVMVIVAFFRTRSQTVSKQLVEKRLGAAYKKTYQHGARPIRRRHHLGRH